MKTRDTLQIFYPIIRKYIQQADKNYSGFAQYFYKNHTIYQLFTITTDYDHQYLCQQSQYIEKRLKQIINTYINNKHKESNMTLDDLFVGLILREKDNSYFYKITQKDSNQALMNRILISSTGGYHRIAIDVLRFKNNIEIVNNLPFNDAKLLAQNRHVCGIYNDRLRNENKFLFYDKRWILQSEGVEDSQEHCDNLSMQDLDSKWYIVYNVRQYFNKGKGLLNKKITNIGFYYDGGTIEVSFEDSSNLFIDYKIASNTSGQFYNVYPNGNDENKIQMTIENMGQLLKQIIRYYEHK